VGAHALLDEERGPVVAPGVVLAEAASVIVPVPSVAWAGDLVHPGHGTSDECPVGRTADLLQHERASGRTEHLRHRDPGGGERLQPVHLGVRGETRPLDDHDLTIVQARPPGRAHPAAVHLLERDRTREALGPLVSGQSQGAAELLRPRLAAGIEPTPQRRRPPGA
jgi:hypothetical protein